MNHASPPRLRPLPEIPRVTVITMCKDRAWCIEQCVQSVLRQDYPNIEHLVHDGASGDGTLDVLRRYEDRIRLHSEPDRGPMDAFHHALARATGDIVCMLLSDERFADERVVSRAVQAVRAHPGAGAIYGDFRVVDVEYREIRIERKRQFRFEEIFCQDDFIAPCAAFVRTDALRENGAFSPSLRRFFDVIGDYGIWVYVGARYPLTYVPGVVADFMVHGGEVSYRLDHCLAYIRECETAIDAFRGDGYTPRELAALKNRALARVYLNYGNALAGKYFVEPLRLAWKGIRRRPRLVFTKACVAVLVKSAGLFSLLPARADGKRMKASSSPH
jgi:glycosyltransferase involved in cell wall biosynthesis